jgi:acyl dehydratase
VTARWPHHLPGELIIALTGQAGVIALRRTGAIDAGWRGHGVRIREARFSAAVLLGETFYTRVEVGRVRRLGDSLHVRFRFRMWKRNADGSERETFRSEQDAIFFPGAATPPTD